MLDTYNDTMVNFILCISYHNEKLNEGEKMKREERGRKEEEKKWSRGKEEKRQRETSWLILVRLHIICKFLESYLSFSSLIFKNI